MSNTTQEYGPRSGLIVPQPSVERGVAAVLGVSPDGKLLAYGNGTNVIVRSIEDPSLSFVYGEHTAAVKVAKFSPTGKYVASGDASGKVRVWALTHVDHLLKYELPSIGGEIEDIAWDSESKRILAVGAGSLKAKVFAWDTGSNLAEIIPHAKKNLTCDFKPSRPFKLVIGGEDFHLSFYTGPPFKYEKGLKEHGNFVNCVRYSPDGSRFVSVSSDKKALVYDGTTAEIIGKLDAATGHTGSIYSVAWNVDGTRLATSGADKTVKVWDMTANTGGAFPLVTSFTLGSRPEDMQNAIVWPANGRVISLSLDGTLNMMDSGAPQGEAPALRVVGHVAPVNVFDYDAGSGLFYTGDQSGRVAVWTPINEERTRYTARLASGASAPTKFLAGIAAAGGELAAVAWDDKLRLGDAATAEFTVTIALPGQPKSVAGVLDVPRTWIVVTSAAVLLVERGAITQTIEASWGPTCVAVSSSGGLVAVGATDKRVHLFKLAGGTLTAAGETREANAAISAVAIAPNGKRFAAGDAGREVRLYDATGASLITGRWMAHTTRVTGLRWSPSGTSIASVSTDRRLCIWDPESETVRRTYDLAHPQPFAAVTWANEDTLWTLGTDGVAVRRVLVL